MRYIPFILSYVVLAAHFLRYGQLAIVLLCLLFPFILLVRKPWVPALAYRVTGFAGLIWVFITVNLYMDRIATGQDWIRMVIILGSVAAFTVFSAFLLKSEKVRSRYRPEIEPVSVPETDDQ